MERPNDALVMRDLQVGIPFGYYYEGQLKLQVASINQQTTPLDELVTGHDRLWIVYRRPFEPTHELAGSGSFNWQEDQDPIIHDWLMAHESQLAQEKTFPGEYGLQYQLKPTIRPD
jgi:hypothetical protein